MYTGLRGAAWGQLPASGTVLRIILYLSSSVLMSSKAGILRFCLKNINSTPSYYNGREYLKYLKNTHKKDLHITDIPKPYTYYWY